MRGAFGWPQRQSWESPIVLIERAKPSVLTLLTTHRDVQLVETWCRARGRDAAASWHPSIARTILSRQPRWLQLMVVDWDRYGHLVQEFAAACIGEGTLFFCLAASRMSAVAALRARAIDHLDRPYDPLELWARLDARIAAQTARREQRTVWLDPERQTVATNGVTFTLRRAESAVLAELARQPNRALTATKLLSLSLRTHGDGGSVRNHVYEIRKAFRQHGLTDPIETEPRRGYRIAGDVLVAPVVASGKT